VSVSGEQSAQISNVQSCTTAGAPNAVCRSYGDYRNYIYETPTVAWFVMDTNRASARAKHCSFGVKRTPVLLLCRLESLWAMVRWQYLTLGRVYCMYQPTCAMDFGAISTSSSSHFHHFGLLGCKQRVPCFCPHEISQHYSSMGI
jgi:hypothetical protein